MSGRRGVRRVAPAFMSFDECIRLGLEDARRMARRRRHRQLAVAVSVLLALAAVMGGGLWLLDMRVSDAEAMAGCERTVQSLSDLYSYASNLHGRLKDVFERGDAGYDLDALAAAYDVAPPGLPALDCSADPSLPGLDADSLSDDLDGYVSWLEDLLSVE